MTLAEELEDVIHEMNNVTTIWHAERMSGRELTKNLTEWMKKLRKIHDKIEGHDKDETIS